MALKTAVVCVALVALVLLPTCVVGRRSLLDQAGVEASMGNFGEASGLEVGERHVSLLPHRRLLQKVSKKRKTEENEKKVEKVKDMKEDELMDTSGSSASEETAPLETGNELKVEQVELRDLRLVEPIREIGCQLFSKPTSGDVAELVKADTSPHRPCEEPKDD